MNRVSEDIIIGWSIMLMAPILFILGALTFIWLVFFGPFILGGLLIWVLISSLLKKGDK